jgi:chromosomal replication initiation ATPase DnaA
MEEILQEITERQNEITQLYVKLRRTMRIYKYDTAILSDHKMNRAEEDLKHVCETLDLTVDRVCSTERSSDVLMVRQALSYIFYEKYGITLSAIGRLFNRDHSTIINSINKIKDSIWLYEHQNVDTKTLQNLNAICEIVGVSKITKTSI